MMLNHLPSWTIDLQTRTTTQCLILIFTLCKKWIAGSSIRPFLKLSRNRRLVDANPLRDDCLWYCMAIVERDVFSIFSTNLLVAFYVSILAIIRYELQDAYLFIYQFYFLKYLYNNFFSPIGVR